MLPSHLVLPRYRDGCTVWPIDFYVLWVRQSVGERLYWCFILCLALWLMPVQSGMWIEGLSQILPWRGLQTMGTGVWGTTGPLPLQWSSCDRGERWQLGNIPGLLWWGLCHIHLPWVIEWWDPGLWCWMVTLMGLLGCNRGVSFSWWCISCSVGRVRIPLHIVLPMWSSLATNNAKLQGWECCLTQGGLR